MQERIIGMYFKGLKNNIKFPPIELYMRIPSQAENKLHIFVSEILIICFNYTNSTKLSYNTDGIFVWKVEDDITEGNVF